MKSERWQKINLLFHSALKIESGRRAAYLDQACGGDASLRAEVESLIAAHDEAGGFIETPAFAAAAEMLGKDETPSLVGQSFGPYRIVSALGAGGMGEVYLAQDTRLGRKVALKLLPAYFTRDEKRVHRFQQEARAASALNHPNIITIHEIGQLDGRHFIAMEFIDGETLGATLERAHLKLPATLDVAIQIASALVAAHKAGIVHRDLKPENIMLRREDDLVKVLDFGLVKLTENPTPHPPESAAPTRAFFKTVAGVVMGTVSYMSPEQARGLEVDARTDLFSLGVILYEMLSGNLPFEGATASDIMAAVLKTEPVPLADDTPAELQRIVRKSLQKNTNERYQTAKDLLIDLKALQHELNFTAELERSGIPKRAGHSAGRQDTNIRTPSAAHIAGGITHHKGSLAVELAAERKSNEAQTVSYDSTEHRTARLTNTPSLEPNAAPSAATTHASSGRRKIIWGAFALLALLVIGGGGYRYFGNHGNDRINSIAVMPFVNASGNSDLEYLSDGLTDSLIFRFSQLPNVKVSPTSSVMRFKSTGKDVAEIAKELSVDAVLTGRLMRAGDELSISVQLVDARTQKLVWAEQYDRKISDLLATQREIATTLTQKMQLRLAGDELGIAKKYTTSNEAYQLYLKGRYHYSRRDKDDLLKAIDSYKHAIELDPNFALAYAATAEVYNSMGKNPDLPPKDCIPLAKQAALRALEIDPMLPQAHSALGDSLALYDWNWSESELHFKKALELDPNISYTHVAYGLGYLTAMGQADSMVTEMERGVALEPLSMINNSVLTTAYVYDRKYDKALVQARSTYDLDPNFLLSRVWLGFALIANGKYDEAISAIQKESPESSFGWMAAVVIAQAYAKQGKRAEAEQQIAILHELAKTRYIRTYYLAAIYATLGDKDKALAELEKSFADRDCYLGRMPVDPAMDSLRDDPRFKNLLKRIGLPQYVATK